MGSFVSCGILMHQEFDFNVLFHAFLETHTGIEVLAKLAKTCTLARSWVCMQLAECEPKHIEQLLRYMKTTHPYYIPFNGINNNKRVGTSRRIWNTPIGSLCWVHTKEKDDRAYIFEFAWARMLKVKRTPRKRLKSQSIPTGRMLHFWGQQPDVSTSNVLEDEEFAQFLMFDRAIQHALRPRPPISEEDQQAVKRARLGLCLS